MVKQTELDWMPHLKPRERREYVNRGLIITECNRRRKVIRDRAYQRARRAKEKEL